MSCHGSVLIQPGRSQPRDMATQILNLDEAAGQMAEGNTRLLWTDSRSDNGE
jgi:hypothetical protein